MNKQLEKDLYFLRIAEEVSKASKCLSRKIGSLIVKDNIIISVGYNGPSRGVKHCEERNLSFYDILDNQTHIKINDKLYPQSCPRRLLNYESGQGLHLCPAQHSEENAITQAARNGISILGTTIYAYCGQVCKNCAGTIVNAGIKRLVYLKGNSYDAYSEIILKEGGIEVTEIDKELVDAI